MTPNEFIAECQASETEAVKENIRRTQPERYSGNRQSL